VTPPPDGACTDILQYHVHRATIRFNQLGGATVRVRGRAEPDDRVLTVERQVTVQ
jgi:hypothetical protein